MSNNLVNKQCQDCGAELIQVPNNTKRCKNCAYQAKLVAKRLGRKIPRDAQRTEINSTLSIGKPVNRIIGNRNSISYDYQTALDNGCYKLSCCERTYIKQECMECKNPSPRCGFAPAFSLLPLETPVKRAVDKVVLLCWDCYVKSY